MNRKKCGLDLDGVVYKFIEEFDEFAKMSGYKIKKKDYDRGIEREELIALLHDFSESRPFLWVPTYPKIKKNLKRLAEKNMDFYIITHRKWSEQGKEDTLERLAHDQIPYKDVIFSGDKAHWAKELNLDYFIEDNLDNAKAIAKTNTLTFLVDKPYNRERTQGKIVRIKSLDEIR